MDVVIVSASPCLARSACVSFIPGGAMRDIRRRLLALAGAVVLVGTGTAFAQNPVTISGRVTNEAAAPLPYAEVSIPTLGLGAIRRPGSLVIHSDPWRAHHRRQ